MRLVEGVGALASEGANVTGATVREGELEAGSHELLDVRALDVLGLLNLGDLENVDRGETSTVAGSHVLVERLGGLSAGERAELLVHVVGTRSRVVSEPDSEVLDLEGLLLVNLLVLMQRGERESVLLCFVTDGSEDLDMSQEIQEAVLVALYGKSPRHPSALLPCAPCHAYPILSPDLQCNFSTASTRSSIMAVHLVETGPSSYFCNPWCALTMFILHCVHASAVSLCDIQVG